MGWRVYGIETLRNAALENREISPAAICSHGRGGHV